MATRSRTVEKGVALCNGQKVGVIDCACDPNRRGVLIIGFIRFGARTKMPINRDLWTDHIFVNRVPDWPCPRCEATASP